MKNFKKNIKPANLFFGLLIFLLLGCTENKKQTYEIDALGDIPNPSERVLEIKAKTKETFFKTIRKFGNSGNWSTPKWRRGGGFFN